MITPKEIVEQFWKTMATNDFNAASRFLHSDFTLDWPQSGERISGPENYAAMNKNYPSPAGASGERSGTPSPAGASGERSGTPTNGSWEFTIHSLIAEEQTVVSDVSVTDGVQHGRAITYSTICDGKIIHQTEFWPDPFQAPEWRKAYVV